MKKYTQEQLKKCQKKGYQLPVVTPTFRAGLYAPTGSFVGGNLLHVPK